MPDNKNICHSCTDCGVLNCARRSGSYPEFCPTAALTEEEINEVTDLYIKNRTNHKIAVASAEVEGGFYGKYTRVEEIIEFARKIGVKKIGIATCVGLIEESRIFARILKLNGFEVYGIGCKVGSVDKTDIGIDEKYTCVTGKVMCNSYFEVASTLGANHFWRVFKVGVPAAMPSIFLGLFNGICSSFVTLMTAEMIGAKYGMGWYVNWQKEMMCYANVYAGLIVIAVLFYLVITVLFKVRDKVLLWQKGVIKW